MKKSFSFLLFRIGTAILVLGAIAWILIAIVKLLIFTLAITGIAALVFRIMKQKRNQYLSDQPLKRLPFGMDENATLAVQPIFAKGSSKKRTIVPIQ